MKHLIVVITTLTTFACATSGRTPQTDNAQLAAKIFGMTFDPAAKSVSAENFSGIRTENVGFLRRIDSRTYLMYDAVASRGSAPLFGGTDEELLQRARTVLTQSGIPAKEVASARVLSEQRGVASVDPVSHAVQNRKITKGTRYALMTRQIDEIPVFTSRLLLTVGQDGRPSFAEVHWPVIPEAVVAEGKRLQNQVRQGWKPPEVRGTHIEHVEAGIIHSPASATVLDVAAVIRVIYSSTDPRVGMKEQRFFNADGRAVDPPRVFAKMPSIPNREKERATVKP